MKIAQVTPLYEAVPPKLYGGTERVVAHLTDALVDLGHEVTLFASADAQTRARLVPVRDQAIRLDPAPLKSDLAAHMTMLSEVLDRVDQFDVIHFHTDMIHFPLFRPYADRTITTLHGRLDLKDLPGVYDRWSDFGLISISDDQRRPLPHANWKATVHHGMPGDQYVFSPKSEGYLAFLGRISPEKRPDRAIEIATKLGRPLKMAAKVDAADKIYWEETIRPMVEANPLIEFIGEIGDHHMHVRRRGHDGADIARPAGLEADEAPEGGLAIKHRSAAMLEPRGHPGIAQRQRQEEDPAHQHHPRREIAHRGDQHRGQGENARADHPVEREQRGAPEADRARRCNFGWVHRPGDGGKTGFAQADAAHYLPTHVAHESRFPA